MPLRLYPIDNLPLGSRFVKMTLAMTICNGGFLQATSRSMAQKVHHKRKGLKDLREKEYYACVLHCYI